MRYDPFPVRASEEDTNETKSGTGLALDAFACWLPLCHIIWCGVVFVSDVGLEDAQPVGR